MGGVQWTVRDYVYVAGECLTGLLSVLGNVLVLLAIKKTHSLRTVTNCFIGSLAAADTLVGLVIPPTVVLTYLGLPWHFYGCILQNSLVVLITNISILSLLDVALERFLAVKNPFLYQRTMSKNRALVSVVITWIVAILIGLIPMMGWHLGDEGFTICSFTSVIDLRYMVYLIFFGMTLPLLFAMLIIYLYIFHIIRKQQQRTRRQLNVLSRAERRVLRQHRQEVRGAKGLAYVIILFAVCWLPLHIMNSVTLFAPEKSAPYEWLLGAIVLSHVNSVINPFLYAFSNSKFKHAMKRVLFCGSRLTGEYHSTDESSWIRKKVSSLLFKGSEVTLATSAIGIYDSATSDSKSPEWNINKPPNANKTEIETPVSTVPISVMGINDYGSKHGGRSGIELYVEKTLSDHEHVNKPTVIPYRQCTDVDISGRTEGPKVAAFSSPGIQGFSDHVWMTPSPQSIELSQTQLPHTQPSRSPRTFHTHKHRSKEENQSISSDDTEARVQHLYRDNSRCRNEKVICQANEEWESNTDFPESSQKPENTVLKEENRELGYTEEDVYSSVSSDASDGKETTVDSTLCVRL